MSRLPIPGSDDGVWGQVLNDFLNVVHNPDGTLQSGAVVSAGGYIKPSGGVPSTDLTAGTQNALALANGSVQSVNAKAPVSGNVTLAATDLSDTAIASPINNQVLAYDSASGKWVNQSTAGGVTLDSTSSDIQPLGSQAAGATGKAADAGHVHVMPRLDQVGIPTSSVSLSSQKITGLSAGTSPTDAVNLSQVPAVGSAGSGAGNALSANDPTTSNSRSPAGAATGDLSGNYPSPTVAKINGVTLPGTAPSVNQVLTALSSSTTGWTTPSTTPGSATSSTPGLIQLDGDLGNTAAAPEVVSTHLSSALPINQGGTGSTTQNFIIIGGDLGGSVTSPAVESIQGVSISGTPSSGRAIVASSSSAASWSPVAGTTDWLNAVSGYGADVSGATDSTTAIQNALNACVTGGIVYLPAGTYVTSAPIHIPPTVTLLGSHGTHLDAIATCIKPSGSFSGAAVIQLVDQTTGGYASESYEQRIYQLSINGVNLPGGNTVDGIQFTGFVHGVYMQDLFITNIGGHGITNVANSSGTSYSHRGLRIVADATGSYGFSLNMTDCTWIDLEAIGCGGTTHGGFFIGGAGNSHFTDCRAEWSGTSGFSIGGSTGTGTGSGGPIFTNCSTDRNTAHGFNITSTGNAPLIFNGCAARRDGRNGGAGGGAYAGFNVTSATCPILINGLTVYPGVDDDGTQTSSPEHGVAVTGSTYVALNSGWLHSAGSAIFGSGNTVFRVNPNVGTATGTTSSPTFNYNNPWSTDNGSTFTANLNGNDQTAIVIAQAAGSTNTNNPLLSFQTGNNGNDILVKGSVSGDTNSRFVLLTSGKLSWGSGAATADTDLYRNAAGVLKTDGSITVNSSLGVGVTAPATGLSTLVGSASAALFQTNVSGTSGNTSAIISAIGVDTLNRAFATNIVGDTNGRYAVYSDGTVSWGPGTSVRDVQLQRTGAGTLTVSPINGQTTSNLTLSSTNLTIDPVASQTGITITAAASPTANLTEWHANGGAELAKIDYNGNFTSFGATVTTNLTANDQTGIVIDQASGKTNLNLGMLTYQSGTSGSDYFIKGGVIGDTNSRFGITSGGALNWAAGTTNFDTNLYRESAGVLQSDNVIAAQGFSATGVGGATFGARFVGATSSGAPATGAFLAGDFIIDQTAKIWVCTTAGSPGTWTQLTTSAGGTAGGDLSGTYPTPTVVATHLSSALPVNQGGTNATAASAAYGNLSPMTTIGDLEYESAANVASRLPGNATAVPMQLTSTGTGAAALSPNWQRKPDWMPSDHGLISWSFDPAIINAVAIVPTAGQVNLVKLHVPISTTITNVILSVSTAGSGLTPSQNFAALYNASGSLLSATSDQSGIWNSTGVKLMALSSPPSVAAGDYYLAFYANGTTLPTFRCGGNSGSIANANLGLSSSRFCTADTGRTTSMPGTLAAVAAQSVSWFAAIN